MPSLLTKTHRPFIPKWMRDLSLTAGERAVLDNLWSRANKENISWPSAKTIAEECRIHRDTVFEALSVLESIGALTRQRGRNSNTFILKLPPFPDAGNQGTSELIGNKGHLDVGKEGTPDVGNEGTQRVSIEAAATAAASSSEIQIDDLATADSGAFRAGLAPAPAPLSDQAWVMQPFTMLELGRLKKSVASLSGLELWQIAEIHTNWQQRKLEYWKQDVRPARKARPMLTPAELFAEEVESQRGVEWREHAQHWQRFNAKPDKLQLNAMTARQPTNDKDPTTRGYEEHMAEGRTGEPHVGVFYDTDWGDTPRQWRDLSAWQRAIIAGNYRGEIKRV